MEFVLQILIISSVFFIFAFNFFYTHKIVHISKASIEIKKSLEASHSELKYLLACLKKQIEDNKTSAHKNINWPPKMRHDEYE